MLDKTLETTSILEEVLEFLTSSPSCEQIIAFHPSQEMQHHVSYLLEMNRNGTLTPEEQEEMEEISRLEHFITQLKIKAQEKLDNQA